MPLFQAAQKGVAVVVAAAAAAEASYVTRLEKGWALNHNKETTAEEPNFSVTVYSKNEKLPSWPLAEALPGEAVDSGCLVPLLVM